MTRVDFYVLAASSRGDRYTLACRLAEKAWHQGHRVYLHTGSGAESKHLNRVLWTFREGSFLPHALLEQADADLNPILIGNGPSAGEEHDVLINLSRQVPDFFSRFERVIEPLDSGTEIRATGRERYRFYRDRGYPLNNHEVN